MRLAGYLRVSTRRQAVEGWSLAEQRAVVEEWAAANGHDVVLFEDPAVSGAAPLDRRKGLLRALGCLYRGEVAGIVVARLDRLTRDLILQEQLLADIWGHGGEVLSCVAAEAEFLRRDDPKDPSRRLIRQVLGAVIEYNKSTSRLLLEAGRLRKGEAGGYIGGRPRYGFAAVGGELVPVPEQQVVIEDIKALRTRQRMTLRQIRDTLFEAGIPGPEGGWWTDEAIRRVLTAEGVSTGAFPRKRGRKKRVHQPKLRRPVRKVAKRKPHRVRTNAEGKAIVPNVDWRGTTEGAPW